MPTDLGSKRLVWLGALTIAVLAAACGSSDGGLSGPSQPLPSSGDAGGTEAGGSIPCKSDNECTPHGMLCNKDLGLCELPGAGGASGTAGTGGGTAGSGGGTAGSGGGTAGAGGGTAGTGGGTAGSGGGSAGTGGSDEWPGPGVGEVVCGPSADTCDRAIEYCCNGPLSKCVPNGGECPMGIVQECDGPSDCPGAICCMYGMGVTTRIVCDADCTGFWVCDEDPEACPAGTECIAGAISYCN